MFKTARDGPMFSHVAMFIHRTCLHKGINTRRRGDLLLNKDVQRCYVVLSSRAEAASFDKPKLYTHHTLKM